MLSLGRDTGIGQDSGYEAGDNRSWLERIKMILLLYMSILMLFVVASLFYSHMLSKQIGEYSYRLSSLKSDLKKKIEKATMVIAYIKAAERVGILHLDEAPDYIRGITKFEDAVGLFSLDFKVMFNYSGNVSLYRAKKELGSIKGLRFTPFTTRIVFPPDLGLLKWWLVEFCNELKMDGALIGEITCRSGSCRVSGILVTKDELGIKI